MMWQVRAVGVGQEPAYRERAGRVKREVRK